MRYRRASPETPQAIVLDTAIEPTSAMAAHIAISAPAAAVRATADDSRAQQSAGGVQASAPHQVVTHYVLPQDGQPTAVTATLQAAEHMRMAQQAHIDAQNEEFRRRAAADSQNGLAMQNVSNTVSY
jgi:hypothetical protein